jgi:hypothetical protein
MTVVAAQGAWCISVETLCLFSSSGSSNGFSDPFGGGAQRREMKNRCKHKIALVNFSICQS